MKEPSLPPLPPADMHCLSAAMGWRELENPVEALAELERVSPESQSNPVILEFRWELQAEQGAWVGALATAEQLVRGAPERPSGFLHQAYAARRVPGGSVEAAWQILRPVADRFPKERLIAYNLACYLCQMQRLDEARLWLRKSFELGNKAKGKAMALRDEDLKALWGEIEGI